MLHSVRTVRYTLVLLLRIVVARHVHIGLLELLHERLELCVVGLADDFRLGSVGAGGEMTRP